MTNELQTHREAIAVANAAYVRAQDAAHLATRAEENARFAASQERARRPGQRPSDAPKTGAELAEIETRAAGLEARDRVENARRELDRAREQLLACENRILDDHRDGLAREIHELRRTGASPATLAAKLAELRELSPDMRFVRRHQQFTLSPWIQDLIRPAFDDLHRPINELRGDASITDSWERRRSQILAPFETESNPLQAA